MHEGMLEGLQRRHDGVVTSDQITRGLQQSTDAPLLLKSGFSHWDTPRVSSTLRRTVVVRQAAGCGSASVGRIAGLTQQCSERPLRFHPRRLCVTEL